MEKEDMGKQSWKWDNAQQWQNYQDTYAKRKMGEYLIQKETDTIISILRDETLNSCLDLGCGDGHHSVTIAQKGIDTIALDISLFAVKRIKDYNFERITPLCADIKALPFKNSRFDFVNACQITSYFDLDKYLNNINRILKIDGLFLFTLSNRRSYKTILGNVLAKDTNAYKYTFAEVLTRLYKYGFKIEKCIGYCWPPFRRESDNKLIPAFDFLENIFFLDHMPSISPWVIYIVRKVQDSS